MKTSSNGNIFRVTGHLCGEFTGPRWIPRTKASDVELWCARINGRVNNGEAGDLRRHRAHCDVIVMYLFSFLIPWLQPTGTNCYHMTAVLYRPIKQQHKSNHINTFANWKNQYRQISNISRTKSQSLNVSGLVWQLYFPNPLKPGVKSRMKM